jgi:hypothetical protein
MRSPPTRPPRRAPWSGGVLACGVLVAILVASACERGPRRTVEITPTGRPSVADTAPDCPHDYRTRNRLLAEATQFRTDIPEYHDCQRLIVRPAGASRDEFGPIAGVFAFAGLDTLTDDHFATPTLVGLVYVPSGAAYAALELAGIYNCIILYRQGTVLGAWMVPVTAIAQCATPVPPASLTANRRLRVKLHAPPEGMTAADIPAVARWDRDPRSGWQYIGLRCGGYWCEIGRRGGYDSSKRYDDAALATPKPRRNFRIPGYYDEQALAVATPGGPLRPFAGLGTLIPAPDLFAYNALTTPPPAGQWVEVAWVYMEPNAADYGTKFNFVGAPLGPPNKPPTAEKARVSLCRGDATTCFPADPVAFFAPRACSESEPAPGWPATAKSRWYARVDHPTQGARYFCVVYRPHPHGFSVPAVVRWRWRDDDETMWVSCPAGCCEVNALM